MTTKLTDTQKQTIRIALAKWMGWKTEPTGIRYRGSKALRVISPEGRSYTERKGYRSASGDTLDIWSEDQASEYYPNYPASLDACHEIEVKLTDAEHKRFRERLLDLIPKGHQRDYVGIQRNQVAWQSRCYVSAKAEHRAVALFRALNLGARRLNYE